VNTQGNDSGQVDEAHGFGGAYYLPPTIGDSPFDHGESMEALLRQGEALYAAVGAYNRSVRWYCRQALRQFDAPPTVAPIPPSAVAKHTQNMATLEALASKPAGSVVPSVATNYRASIDHTRHVLMVSVDVSGRVKASDGVDKRTNTRKYHLSKRKTGRTIQVANSQLAFTMAVGYHETPHGEAQAYDAVNASTQASPLTPTGNIGVHREGDTFTLWASFDERRVSAEHSGDSTVLARSAGLRNPKRRTVYLSDGLWYTFRVWAT
jgi:hypothetical protein